MTFGDKKKYELWVLTISYCKEELIEQTYWRRNLFCATCERNLTASSSASARLRSNSWIQKINLRVMALDQPKLFNCIVCNRLDGFSNKLILQTLPELWNKSSFVCLIKSVKRNNSSNWEAKNCFISRI